MITKTKNGFLVSSKNVTLDSTEQPKYICSKCGCVYWNELDIVSLLDPEVNDMRCNECDSELIPFKQEK